jgi:hypothetical protein
MPDNLKIPPMLKPSPSLKKRTRELEIPERKNEKQKRF